jgi:hypothetical protein
MHSALNPTMLGYSCVFLDGVPQSGQAGMASPVGGSLNVRNKVLVLLHSDELDQQFLWVMQVERGAVD